MLVKMIDAIYHVMWLTNDFLTEALKYIRKGPWKNNKITYKCKSINKLFGEVNLAWVTAEKKFPALCKSILTFNSTFLPSNTVTRTWVESLLCASDKKNPVFLSN